MIGYLPQYELAAWVIIRHLREQSLDSIRLGDPNAGRVDDFVVLSTNAVDGYSVKWSEYRDTVTFTNLIRPREKAPPWIAQLADGWKKLRASYPQRRATVHLVTCDNPSTSDKCPGPDGEQKPFAAFFHQSWLPFQDEGRAVATEWASAWEALRAASGLNADEFKEFANACRLDFNARLAADRPSISQDELVHTSQLRELARVFADIVRDPSHRVEFSKDELLTRVRWSHLLELRHRHEFPTRDPYEPIDSTVKELAAKLSKLPGGYIALLGSPGSGKSTLLTRTLEAGLSKHRLVKYYAFVPGSTDPRATRGESVHFLHDLVLSLERAGFAVGQSQGIFDRTLLLDRLHKQLQMLRKDFAKSGFPTVILIDGLDHIPREQQPQQSLIADLPAPEQVPAGVYFVLGSQTDNLPGLPPAVRQSIQDAGRRVMIEPLSREAVLKVIAASTLPVALTQPQQETVVTLAGGHPLALSLLLNRLGGAARTEQVAAALSDTVAFAGDVDTYYFAYWQQIESHPNLADLLGLLARLRRPIGLDWVASWTPTPPLAELQRRFAHFFREERPGHWVFFHNSFRQYVLCQSAELQGATPEAADRTFHIRLATICESSVVPHSWEVVFHLAMAGQLAKVLALATPEYFRKQLHALRPLESISRDARYVALAAGRQKDATAIVRTAFFLSELSQRSYSLSAWRVGGFLLSMGYLNEAMEYLWEGNELQIHSTEALRVARRLFFDDHEPLARRVFDAAEPLSLIQPVGEAEDAFNRDTSELLRRWAEAAPLFRPVEEVIELIKGFVPPKPRWGEETPAEEWRCNLLFWAAHSMEQFGRMADAAAFEKSLVELEGDKPGISVWLYIHRFGRLRDEGKLAEAKGVLERLVQSPKFDSFSDHAKLLIAQGAPSLSGRHDIAAHILKTVKQPVVSLDSMQEPDFSDALEFFRFFRLLMLTGADVSPHTVAPDPTDPEQWPRVLLARTLVQLAKVSADAERGKFYKVLEIRQYLHHPLRLYQRTVKKRRRWHSWYRVEGLRKDIDRLLVDVVHEHGPDAVEALRAEMERLWNDKGTAWVWATDARRNVVMALFDAGVPEEWAKKQLEDIGQTMLANQDVSGKVDQCEAQAKAWRVLDNDDAAIAELKRLVSVSFGVGYRKDYQMDEWVAWLEKVLSLELAKVPERIALFAAAIAATEETTEGRGTRTAALALIKCCVPVSPRRAVALIHWFETYGCIDHASAVATVLQTAAEKKLCRASTLEAVYTHFLLTFSTNSHSELAQLVLSSVAGSLKPVELAAVCRRLVNAVKTRALPTMGPVILGALAERAQELKLSLAACGLEVVPPRPTPEGEYKVTLKLKDGTTLSEEAVGARAATVDGFIALLAQHNESYYRWGRVLDSLLPKLSHAEATKLVQKLPTDFKESLALSQISRRLSELGDRNAAWQVGELALESSSSYGWSRQSDGGTRLDALAALVAANPTRGRVRAVKELTENLSSDSGSPFDIARHLIDIAPLLDANVKLEGLYPLVEEYVSQLAAPLLLLDGARAAFGPPVDDDTVERAVCDLLTLHMGDLVPLLAQGAMKSMCELLLNGSAPAERAVKVMLTGTVQLRTAAVALLEVVGTAKIEAVKVFSGLLRGLILSRNLWVSATADWLCREMELDGLPVRPYAPLPGIYSLVLRPSPDKMPIVEPDEPLPESQEPRDHVRPLDFQLGIIAKMAGLPEENLFTAAASEMKRISEPAELTVESEKAYRSYLEGAGLKLPFRRRRGAIAREAVQRIASDLFDARRISDENMPMLLQLLSFTDPVLALVDPSERPVGVKPIEGLGPYGGQVKEWTSQVPASLSAHLRRIADRVVLAETTKLKGLEWATPTETRVSLIGERSIGTLDDGQPFERVFDVRVDEYSESRPLNDDGTHVIVKNQWLGADTDGVEWLALNPNIAEKLGWTLAPEGLFRWVDKAGNTMVETIWWKDGCVELPPYERDNEVGEGFLILASHGAAAEIGRLLKEPTRFLVLQRSCQADHEMLTGPVVQQAEACTKDAGGSESDGTNQ